MSQLFNRKAKNLLEIMGKSAGFVTKNEYRLRIDGLGRPLLDI